ncbi:DUF3450 domain-containing protein [Halopseudomonas nanhaiensis]|uniref:DUF3450 domain-containing protein n=1 Tax=Halopseudomonas nanhaiensis TaxID=2830842 RepID=UPI001CBD05B8|nr:DUF3450 domain-containing protein [Halopseudomonas nanhaiensis]UAW98112.1 DUF3450 domain-containing protein [Halopseudomonas nanhaiensis]
MRSVFMVAAAVASFSVLAQDAAQRALDESEALTRDAVQSQQRIDALDDATRDALERYRQALTRREQLVDYNQQLERIVASQRDELEQLQTQLASIEDTQHAVLPLLQRMLGSLEQFVELDLPFQLEERRERVAQLKSLMASPGVSVAEKYRRVLEAYQIESDYGRTLEAWRGALHSGDDTRVVDFLRLGRVMLFYQTPDGSEQGYWDPQQGSWSALPGDYRRTLEQGMNIARQQQTPALLRMPLPPVQAQEDAQ